MTYDRLYVAFLHEFNHKRDYYECHDLMEELWLQEGRAPLYQGLLQVAVGLYHHGNGNVGGAVKLLRQALDKLRNYPPVVLGIDLADLRAEAEIYLRKLAAAAEHPEEVFAPYDLTIRIADADLATAVEAYSREAESAP